jgi:hypothetical protein
LRIAKEFFFKGRTEDLEGKASKARGGCDWIAFLGLRKERQAGGSRKAQRRWWWSIGEVKWRCIRWRSDIYT